MPSRTFGTTTARYVLSFGVPVSRLLPAPRRGGHRAGPKILNPNSGKNVSKGSARSRPKGGGRSAKSVKKECRRALKSLAYGFKTTSKRRRWRILLPAGVADRTRKRSKKQMRRDRSFGRPGRPLALSVLKFVSDPQSSALFPGNGPGTR